MYFSPLVLFLIFHRHLLNGNVADGKKTWVHAALFGGHLHIQYCILSQARTRALTVARTNLFYSFAVFLSICVGVAVKHNKVIKEIPTYFYARIKGTANVKSIKSRLDDDETIQL